MAWYLVHENKLMPAYDFQATDMCIKCVYFYCLDLTLNIQTWKIKCDMPICNASMSAAQITQSKYLAHFLYSQRQVSNDKQNRHMWQKKSVHNQKDNTG